MTLSPSKLLQVALTQPETLQKRRMETDLHRFLREAWTTIEGTDFVDGPHIQAICEHLEAVSDGTIKNLCINIPPRCGKSRIISVFWPAWMWLTKPETQWIFTSHEMTLSTRDSTHCRRVITSPWYQQKWSDAFQLTGDQNSKTRFDNTRKGVRIADSVGGTTGEGADIFVVDDPHNIEDAMYPRRIESAVQWWSETVSTRMNDARTGRKVIIMQRISERDLSAHVIKDKNYVHLCLPMEYEVERKCTTSIGWTDWRTVDGELLWPAKVDAIALANLKGTLGIYGTAGQLQQRPSPRGGGAFKREWFEVVTAMPNCIRFIRYVDKAGTKGGTGAETALVLMGMYEDSSAGLAAFRKKFIIVDCVHGRWAAAERETIIKQTAITDKAKWGYVEIWVEQEPGSGGKESAESTVSNIPGFSVKVDKVTGSKEVRAEPLQAAASVGKIKLLAGAWTQHFLDEAEAFPMGKLKDMIDGASGAYNKLCEATGAFGSASEISTGRGGPEKLFGNDLGIETMSSKDIFT